MATVAKDIKYISTGFIINFVEFRTLYISCRAVIMAVPDDTLSIRLYHPLHLASPLDNILCQYRAVVERFLTDAQNMLVRMKESTGGRRLWARSYFSCSILHVLFVWFEWFLRWEVGDHITSVLWDVASRIC